MATVMLPGSLVALFPGTARRQEVAGTLRSSSTMMSSTVVPGLRDRLVDAGPVLRRHINVFVDGEPADLATEVSPTARVHVLPAVSGGAP